jgi:multidrug efflux pump subunit AcrB
MQLKRLLQNTRLLVLTVVILIVAGFSAMLSLPLAEDPIIRNRNAVVTVIYSGATAEQVESQITEKVEETLQQIDEIKLITSTSKVGISVVNIELHDAILESDPVWVNIRDKLRDLSPKLPQYALTPELDTDHTYAFTTIIALNWQADETVDILLLKRYGERLAKRLRAVTGTEFVDEYGFPNEEISVQLQPHLATSSQQTASSLTQAIADADTQAPIGELIGNQTRFSLELSDSLDSLHRLQTLPISIGDSGQTLQLQDIATVQRQATSPPNAIALTTTNRHHNQVSVFIAARMQPNLRVDQWSQSIQDTLEQFKQALPIQIQATTIFEQRGYTESRIRELLKNLILGFVLILSVLLLTLGLRSAVIVALALPLTSLFTLALMKYTHIPINQMSVTGLIVALGIMVDNAIVMVDTIGQHRKRGKSPIEASIAAIRHLWLPLLGSTLTTILAFMPIVLMPGPAGEFVGAIAVTVSFSLIGSYFISHFIVAILAGRWLPTDNALAWYQSGISLPSIGRFFEKTIKISLHHPIKAIGFTLILPFTGFWGAGQLTEQFFPPSDRDVFEIQVYLSPEASLFKTQSFIKKLDNTLHQYSEITETHWVIGDNMPSFYYNLVGLSRGTPYFAQAMIKTNHFKEANQVIQKLQTTLPNLYPQAQILIRKLEQGPPFNAPIELQLYGNNLDTLKQLGDDLRLLLSTHSAVRHTRTTLQSGLPKATIQLDETALKSIGLSQARLSMQLQNHLTGQVKTHLMENQQAIPIRVRIKDEERQTLNNLSNFHIPILNHPTGTTLSAIADVTLTPSLGSIPHRNGLRVNTIETYLSANVLPQSVLNSLQSPIEQFKQALPIGYHLEIGGESAKRDESVNNLLANVVLIVILMITIIVLAFNSFRISFIIFMVGGLASGLGLFSVWLFQYPFGFTVIIALLGLIGLAINAAIVILSELKTNSMAMTGDPTAIIGCIVRCTRHITSTTITTIGGFIPLVLAGGGFWPPFAIAIAGGTLLTTLLSFYFVPCLFLLLIKNSRKYV